MQLINVMTIAEKELLESIRSKWLGTFTVVFALIALLVSFLGLSSLGVGGQQGFNRVTASLLNLVLYLLPLIALVMGSATVAGEKEAGSLHVLLTQPINKAEVIIGKFGGLALALIASILVGFGGAGVVIAWKTGSINIKDYLMFVILSMILAMVFLSIAILISVIVSRRAQGIGLGIFVWFLMILVYDFLAIGVAGLSNVSVIIPLLLLLLLANPADMVRVLVILQLGGEETFGPTLVALTRMLTQGSGEILLYGALLVWMIIPLLLAAALFGRKQDY